MGKPEIWLPIPGFEGDYEASAHGRVRSVVRILTNSRGATRGYGGKVLKSHPGPYGHRYVTLCKQNVVSTHTVHALVCAAFHGPKPDDKDLVAHWDGVSDHNSADNLRWATYLENEEDKRRHDRHAAGERNPAVKLTAEDVAAIRRRHGGQRGSGTALAREFGVSVTQICDIVKFKCWSEEGNAKRRARRAAGKIEKTEARGKSRGGLSATVWRLKA